MTYSSVLSNGFHGERVTLGVLLVAKGFGVRPAEVSDFYFEAAPPPLQVGKAVRTPWNWKLSQ